MTTQFEIMQHGVHFVEHHKTSINRLVYELYNPTEDEIKIMYAHVNKNQSNQ